MQLRIVHKLFAGYLVLLIIAIVFGLFVFSNMGHVRHKMNFVELADDARDKVLQLRRQEKNYIIRHDIAYLRNIQGIVDDLVHMVDNLADRFAAHGERGQHRRLQEEIRRYADALSEFSLSYRAEENLSSRLRTVGQQIEEQLLDKGTPRQVRLLLEIRLLEKNYVLYKENQYIAELKEKVKRLRLGFSSTPSPGNSYDEYIEIVDQLTTHQGREGIFLVKVQESGQKMQEVIEEVAAKARNEINAYLDFSRRLLVGALAIKLVAGAVLIWYLAKMISRPLQDLAETARKISIGEEELRVAVQGDYETVTLQQSFNSMLDQLQLSRDSLEQTLMMIQDKNAQLVESEKLASIGVLASGVAHEINNPLANISLTAETVLELEDTISREELASLMHDIVEQTDRAQVVVSGLLGFARRSRDAKAEQLNLWSVVQHAVRLVSHELRLRNIHVRQDLPDRQCLINGHHGRLEQVFVNIFLNAAQAIGEEGNIRISLHQDEQRNLAVVEIHDNGRGMTPQQTKKIFLPFYTTKAVGQGTGLGMYISYGIIKDHGGDITVESEEGQGAMFRIVLPLASFQAQNEAQNGGAVLIAEEGATDA